MKKLRFFTGSLFFTLLFIISGSLSGYAQSEEWIHAYFNMPADHSFALPGNESQSSWDLPGTLEALIDSAQYSVDLCMYDLEEPRIAKALVRAKNRGLRIRLVTDNHNRNDAGKYDLAIWTLLAQGNILSIDDDGDIYQPNGSIIDNDLVNDGSDMHNKFAVIDQLSPSPDDDFVWTGSTNMTFTGAYNTNHTLVIKDTDVATAYAMEFEQMWGSTGEIPDATGAVFHKDKKEIGPHVFDVGGTKVEVYFAPVNRDRSKPSVSERLVQVIQNEAQYDINFQAFAITPNIPISEQIWGQTRNQNIQLKGVIDRAFYSRYKSAGDIWASDSATLANRMILPAQELRKLHHKVILLDATHPDTADIGVTIAGSYNFSMNAEMNNDENTVIIYSDAITNQFYQDFMGVISRAENKTYPPAPVIHPDSLYEVFSVTDGSRFSVEVVPGFGYGVRLLGLDVPTIYAGQDSAEYFSGATAEYLQNLLAGQIVKLTGYDGGLPDARRNGFQAYVSIQHKDGSTSLNKLLLEKGYATTSKYYRQNEDSIAAFKLYEQIAQSNEAGLWKSPQKIGSRTLRVKEVDTGSPTNVMFPININTADEATLQLLPGIGPAYSQRIVKYRLEHGSFNRVDELTNIRGIGPKTIQKLRPIVTLE